MQKKRAAGHFMPQGRHGAAPPASRQGTSERLATAALLVESRSGRDVEFGRDSFSGTLAGAGNGLAATNPNVDGAGNDAANAFIVDSAQIAVVKDECDGLRG